MRTVLILRTFFENIKTSLILKNNLSSLYIRFAYVPTIRLGHDQLRWSRRSP
jgi:hypothetical protein